MCNVVVVLCELLLVVLCVLLLIVLCVLLLVVLCVLLLIVLCVLLLIILCVLLLVVLCVLLLIVLCELLLVVCIVVVVLCVLLSSYVYLLYYVCIAVFTLDAGLLASSQYSEGPATGHLVTGFSWFPCVYKQMLRWFPRSKVATTCFSCSPTDLNLISNQFHILYTCKITTTTG